jgi:Tfp pilus assembly protein PilF
MKKIFISERRVDIRCNTTFIASTLFALLLSACSTPPTNNLSTNYADNENLLKSARQAYWSNDLKTSVTLYNQLLKGSPNSIEYKGELANVYRQQGNTQEASKLYAEIAPKLVKMGRITEVLNMKRYIEKVDPELAKPTEEALKKYLARPSY